MYHSLQNDLLILAVGTFFKVEVANCFFVLI